MSLALRFFLGVTASMLLPVSVAAQAFTPPPEVGSVTAAWQWVNNTGHFLTDGTLLKAGNSVTSSLVAEVDYGVTERFAATVAIPFIFAKYTGALPPFSKLERDSCKCWHESFQDFAIAGRYRFGDEFWALTPKVSYVLPSHNYPFEGEAVVGPDLQQLHLSLEAAWRLASVLPKASLTGGYTYSIVEQPLEGVGLNRSNANVELGYAITRALFVHGGVLYQRTHGGVTTFELFGLSPDDYVQRDRIIKTRYWHVSGGVSYSTGPADLFAAVENYAWGRDTHDGIAFTVGSTWYFDFSRHKP